MPYNAEIDKRIREIVSHWSGSDCKKMFGGVCYLINGNMVCGVYKDFLILRLGVDPAKSFLRLPYVKPFDITGRPMKGWIMVEEKGFKEEQELASWLNKAKEFVLTLPSK